MGKQVEMWNVKSDDVINNKHIADIVHFRIVPYFIKVAANNIILRDLWEWLGFCC